MRNSNRTPRASRTPAAAFARQHRIHYTTFCGWRRRRAKLESAPAFVQVELAAPPAADGLVVEPGGGARLRIGSASQIALAAQLLQHLNAAPPCWVSTSS